MKERGAGAPSSERRGLEDLARIAKSLGREFCGAIELQKSGRRIEALSRAVALGGSGTRITALRQQETNSQSLISMSFSVIAGLVPAIHVVQLARGPNAWPTGRQQSETAVRLDDVDGRDVGRSEERQSFDGLCPAMTLGRQMPVSFIRAKSWTAQTDHAIARLGAIAAEDKRLLDAGISAVLLRSVARTTDESTVLS
jgi:hypothetical protein